MGESVKRVMDIFGALFGLIILMPIIIIIAILVRFYLGSPVIFKQVRAGKQGRLFSLYKFRTMLNMTDESGKLLDDAQRQSPLGNKLRKYSLDELPQLFNVLKGDISLVGPRPLLPEYLPLYTSEQMKRHLVRPGITGWAQINGRNLISWEEKFRLDVWYVNNRSLYLDVKILFLTIWKVISTEGINQAGSVSMNIFTGTKERSNNENI